MQSMRDDASYNHDDWIGIAEDNQLRKCIKWFFNLAMYARNLISSSRWRACGQKEINWITVELSLVKETGVSATAYSWW